ncbi:acid protease [Mollisia scopiformis]|uniref:receptor protein-tyrosine kinase n=1 Tax=Mollisia scopiformis TaxID=149040 RepID=A0A194XN73_MOLSC|nr:acid protease [Mollisia scopiformis]KUJ21618.1 acid protease [Mollisia scopiformis]
MRSLSPIVVACLLFVAGGVTADNITLKAPIIATPSEHWEGVDGTWSTFEIHVGTPANVYRVLPATSWQETWVIYGAAAGVCNTSVGVSSNCGDARGGLFNSTDSSTWIQSDQDFLGLDATLGYQGVGQYGFDTVGLGYTNTSDSTLTHQIVAEIVTNYWWFGILGLGFQPTNFSTYGNPQASFSDTLYSNGTISSMSWSYTAGAYYRLKSIFGSLIFGGYDESRFTPNDVIFTMTGDNLRDIVVTIRSIISTTSSGNTTLMSAPEFAFIDSAVPELWLPTTVCQAFEKAFGLTLDSASGLYLINASTHSNLQSLNPNITFTLANQKSGGATVDFVLPYAAFDLNVTEPVLTNSTSFYFPIRSTDDDSLYTLGRTFLQETYVTAHYNSRTFNVSQSIFDDSASPTVIALPANLPTSTSTAPSSTSSTPGSKSGSASTGSSKLSGGGIAGITVGILLAALLAAFLLFCIFRRRRTNREAAIRRDEEAKGPVHEIDPGRRVDPHSTSAYSEQASGLTNEVDGKDARVEKWGIPVMVPQELEADVPPASATSSENGDGHARTGVEMSGGAAGRGGLSPVREHKAKTPMAEMEAEERGLGEPMPERGREREEREEDIVSPNSDTMPSIMGRARGAVRTSGELGHSPTISEGTWSPNSPVQRRGSRFEERL